VSMFRWAAPLFKRFGDRWSESDVAVIASWLRPYVRPGGELLDVGGGTGALAAHLAGALACGATVLDPTPEMLRYVPERGVVKPVLGPAEKMPLPDSAFDAVIVNDAFHHFPDQDGAVREMARVVRPGGAVLVLEMDPRSPLVRAAAWAEKLLGEPGAFFAPDDLCAFFAERGIDGRSEKVSRTSYRFLGVVRAG
jgi:ubiquinone/menaquinone biosynthesis C-methylase UbiE